MKISFFHIMTDDTLAGIKEQVRKEVRKGTNKLIATLLHENTQWRQAAEENKWFKDMPRPVRKKMARNQHQDTALAPTNLPFVHQSPEPSGQV